MPLTLTATESGGFELHDADEWYEGTIVDIEETEGQWGPGLKWIIELDGETHDDGTQRETWAFCSQKLSKRSKLHAWLKGLGNTVDPGDVVDLTQYVDTSVQVMFEHYDGYDPDGNQLEKEKVVKLRAGEPKKKTARSARASKPAQATDYDDAPF